MNEEKKIHIISHTHWDREWYLPFETHHMQLVELMDTLIDTLEKKPGYKNFHLDGQTIILDDYLQVRPHMRDTVQHLVQEGRIQIGPWYILQDEFLTSGESNIRNLQYGLKDAKEWGAVAEVGYFPDSFGNIGQAPQILRQAGITNAVFGRGVKPTGFNNKVADTDTFESPFSEMIWQSPDGSEVTGILFANWYCNGNEVPVDEQEAKDYWEMRIPAMEKYAATSQLLLMNGCDHQPIQTDLPEAIETAEKLYPEYTFVHSSFEQYMKDVQPVLPEDLKVIKGELRSQQTDGWGTLVNTASARLYLKQLNRKAETLLANVAEPMAAFSHILGGKFDRDVFAYAWKTLMQNHPHDSICGCSVDEVHREMVSRFEKSIQVGETLVTESLAFVTDQIDTTVFKNYGENPLAFAIYNTSGQAKTDVVGMELDLKREYFSDGVMKDKLKSFTIGEKSVIDSKGNAFACEVEDLGIHFGYDLPKDRFRQPYMARKVKLSFQAEDVPALGLKTFALVDAKETIKGSLVNRENQMENTYLHVQIENNGSLTVTDKLNSHVYRDLCVYENSGDIGNEYMYMKANGDVPFTTKDLPAKISLVKDTPFEAVYELTHDWELPVSATELLDQEQQEVIEFPYRKAGRSSEVASMQIKTTISLGKNSRGIDVKTSFHNDIKDHRLRVLFATDIETDIHQADSIFEVATRQNEVEKGWTNPDNSQHQQKFVEVGSEMQGLTIVNGGLNEYEVLRDGRNTIAVTLLRSVRELGDWGYFPTPEAQCLGDHTLSYRIIPHQGGDSRMDSYQDAYASQVPLLVKQTDIKEGTIQPVHTFLEQTTGNQISLSAFKVAEGSEDLMARWFNITGESTEIQVTIPQGYSTGYKSTILEQEFVQELNSSEKKKKVAVDKYEIVTIGFKK